MTATIDVPSIRRGTASHLSTRQVARLRDLLFTEREGLAAQLAERTRALVEVGQEGADVEGVEQELVGLHAARARDTLDEIERALTRLAEGSYGICERCDRPVPFERLEVIPRARSCVACPPPSACPR